MRKFTLFLMSLFFSVGAMAQITDVNQLSNDKCYHITSKDGNRGAFYAKPGEGYLSHCGGTYGNYLNKDVAKNPSSTAQQFAFIKFGGKFYLYSVSEKKFAQKDGNYVKLVDSTSDFVTVTSNGSYFNININGTNKLNFSGGYDYGVYANYQNNDDGNNLVITEAGDFNSSEAIGKLIAMRTAYVYNTGHIGKDTHKLTSFTLTDGQNSLTVTDIQTSVGAPVYVDKSAQKITTTAGAELKFSEFNWDGWAMHAYAYIDYNKNYYFEPVSNNNGEGNGEIVSYNYYDGKDITGATNTEGNNQNSKIYGDSKGMPAFKLPADLAPGEYRMRIKIDWNNLDADYGASDIAANAGCQCDITLVVGVEATYTLIDQNGATYEGNFIYDGNNHPTVTGAFGHAITNISWDAEKNHYIGLIEFNYPISNEHLGATNETLLAINGKYIRAVGDDVKVQTTDVAAVDANCLWAIYPTFDNGAFAFAIMNVATGKYMHTDAKSAIHDKQGTIVLSDEATMFTIADNNEFKTIENLYLSINSPANDVDVYLGLYGNPHNGTDIVDVALLQYEVAVTAANYATFYAPVAVKVPAGVTAHTVTINGEWASLSEALTIIPAYTGVVLYSETPATYTFLVTNEQIDPIESNVLDGTVAATYITKEAYVLGIKDGVVGFYTATTTGQTEGTFLNNHHKAYLPASAVPNKTVAFYGFDWDGTTGINEVKTENGEVKAIFDLTGRRVEEITAPGIYIVNGKKVLVK